MNIYQILLLSTVTILIGIGHFAWTKNNSSNNSSIPSDLSDIRSLGLSSFNTILSLAIAIELMEEKLHPPNKPHPT